MAAIDGLTALDPRLRRLLRDVRVSINTVCLPPEDKPDVIDSFRRFVAELAKPDPHPDRLMRLAWECKD